MVYYFSHLKVTKIKGAAHHSLSETSATPNHYIYAPILNQSSATPLGVAYLASIFVLYTYMPDLSSGFVEKNNF